MNEWEYKVVDIDHSYDLLDLTHQLEQIGGDGWELVSVVPVHYRYNEPVTMRYFFKRVWETEPTLYDNEGNEL